jgi:succinate dehydrogenase / fumarate reductase flavoprotein subunit
MKKLPTMYEQFKNLADIDISREPMEVFPTVHYTMGGVKVDPETCESSVPGLFAAGEVAGGLHGPTASAGTRSRTCSSSGAGPGMAPRTTPSRAPTLRRSRSRSC